VNHNKLNTSIKVRERNMTTSTLRKRKQQKQDGDDKDNNNSAYSKLAKENAEQQNSQNNNQKKSMGLVARLMLFGAFPCAIGALGLIAGYIRRYSKDEEDRKLIEFDDDFVFPFILAIAIVIAVGFQTQGFRSKEVKPLIAWPKLKKRRKIIHKVVNEDGEVISEEVKTK